MQTIITKFVQNFSQSNDLELTIEQVTTSDSGSYSCEAINGYGGERKEITIKVLSAPKISVHPAFLSIVENSKRTLKCVVQGNVDDHQFSWIDFDGSVLENVSLKRD